MRNLSVVLALSVAVATASFAPAFANAKRAESCAVTAGIVAKAVEARLAGQSADQAKTALRADGSGITGVYKATIAPLVDMVYGFEKSTLGDAAVEQYETQCLAF